MLTLKQIKLAINNLIIGKFPDTEIQSQDIKQGFKRPCFFVELDNIGRDSHLYSSKRTITVRIYYFPEDRYDNSLEIMDIHDGLESLFNLNLSVGDRVFTINETRGQTIDSVLEFEFDFEYLEPTVVEDGSDLMEDLEFDA